MSLFAYICLKCGAADAVDFDEAMKAGEIWTTTFARCSKCGQRHGLYPDEDAGGNHFCELDLADEDEKS